MKKVLIIGYGYVGKGVHASLAGEHFRNEFTFYDVDFYDPNVEGSIRYPNFDTVDEYAAIFLCLPTPTSKINGKCDYSLIQWYLEHLYDYKGLLILKSTISPSGMKWISKCKPDLIFIPEFLTEKNWLEDSLKFKDKIIVGCQPEQIDAVVEFFSVAAMNWDSILGRKSPIYIQVDQVTASVFKYAANSFLAMKVVFMHEMHKWAKTEGILSDEQWEDLILAMKTDPRLGTSHFKAPGEHGYGYAGTCFPKDIEAFVNESNGDLSLLEQVHTRNKSLRKIINNI